MRFFVDTHDHASQTFPAEIDKEAFAQFFTQYEQAARTEDVSALRVPVGFDDGRAFCFNMAPSAEHVRRAHELVNLPFESITEVATAAPSDLHFQP